MRVADYKDLRVYKLAFDSAMEIFQLGRSWTSTERYSLTDQIRRSSRSVCTNIAEAWRKRRYEAAFVSKLTDADGEAAETEVHLDFALQCGYLSAENHSRLCDAYDHICRQLTIMVDAAASWCGAGRELREIPPEYIAQLKEGPSVEQRGGSSAAAGSTRNPPAAPRSDAAAAPRS